MVHLKYCHSVQNYLFRAIQSWLYVREGNPMRNTRVPLSFTGRQFVFGITKILLPQIIDLLKVGTTNHPVIIKFPSKQDNQIIKHARFLIETFINPTITFPPCIQHRCHFANFFSPPPPPRASPKSANCQTTSKTAIIRGAP